MARFLILILLAGLNFACTRKASTAQVQFQFSAPASGVSAKLQPHVIVNPPSGSTALPLAWGAGGISALSEITCYGVAIATPNETTNTCTYGDESTFGYGVSAGFVSPSETLSIELPPGVRNFKVIATAAAPGQACPKAGAIDPTILARMRVVGEATADLKSGTNKVDILLNLNGKEIETCTGSLEAKMPVIPAATCNPERAGAVATPGSYESARAVVILRQGATFADYSDGLPNPPVGLYTLGGWENLSAYEVAFDSSGDLAADLDKLCGNQLVREVRPVKEFEAPYQHFTGAISPMAAEAGLVAVVSTGIDYDHSVFLDSDAIYINPGEVPNASDDDSNGLMDDVQGYNFVDDSFEIMDNEGSGTHIAGLILQGAGLDITLDPMDPADIKILPVKVFDDAGYGTEWDVVNGILYAVHMGAKVIYIPYGVEQPNLLVKRAIAWANQHGRVVITAAGNSGANLDVTPLYPVSFNFPLNISVMSVTDFGVPSVFSNYGAKTVDLAAPGNSQLSTLPADSFGSRSGTTSAGAWVAGAAAQASILNPSLSGFSLRRMVVGSASANSNLAGKTKYASQLDLTTLFDQAPAMVDDGLVPLVFYPH